MNLLVVVDVVVAAVVVAAVVGVVFAVDVGLIRDGDVLLATCHSYF